MTKKNQLLTIILAIVFALLYLRLMHLQIAEHKRFAKLAAENAAKTISEPAPRGVIYDRNGRVLVESSPIFSVRVLPHVLANKDKEERERILGLLGRMLGEEIEFKVSAAEPMIVKDNISLETAIRIEEKKRELDGVVVGSRPVRLSKYGGVASHVLGYVGEIEAKELEVLREKGYRLGNIIGKDGVEKIYDKQIRGKDGGKKIEVDVYGKPIRILESIDPVSGPDIRLTIDIKLQEAVEEALGAREGAAVVMDVKSGEVLAMASYPDYDPNIFTNPLKKSKWNELMRMKHPFINRALAIYPPGSVFKVVTLAAALEEGVTTPDEVINCKGYVELYKRSAKCWLGSGHGPITVMEGLVWSCDVVFYELGRRLGPDLITKYAQKFGLGSRTGIDLSQEKKGTVPTKEWKKKYFKEPWYEGDSLNYGIGQGFVQVTPLQMAQTYAAIASGKIMKPYIVEEIKDKNGKVIHKAKKEEIGAVPFSSENLALVRKALREVVKRGTGVGSRVEGLPAAGKTGTAENPGVAHAWFVCYAPSDDPEIVVSAFVAHGGHGDKVSAHVARDILEWYKKYRLQKVYPAETFEGQYILRGNNKVPYRATYGTD
jgi:penicillin-binding protein 2